MNFMKRPSVEELQLLSRFENLRNTLLSPERAALLDKPLADWARPSDRRLPFVLLGRKLGDLINTPFMDLAATPGIGQRKIRSLVELLHRAATCDPQAITGPALAQAPQSPAPPDGFVPGEISEVLWDQWRRTALEHQLDFEPVGRLAPSLRHLPRVIWSTPLGTYARLSLAEIRQLRNHGMKRLSAVVEVFYHIHRVLQGIGPGGPLAVRVLPRWIAVAERWAVQRLQIDELPTQEAIREHLIRPLLEQLRLDAGSHVVMLAESRVGLGGTTPSVRQLSRAMGLTRARLYQLLNSISEIMRVRWPAGGPVLYGLRAHFAGLAARCSPSPELRQFHAAVDVFFPGPRRGVDAPLEAGATLDAADGGQRPGQPAASGKGRPVTTGSARTHAPSPSPQRSTLVSLQTAD